ncbi:exosome complex component CSL4 [Galdieria sulphuraria]|uniref:Exosome complex component CSL4 n=1 Tax=Galdieria sulphuraria TaxID=130081 RepID=M2XXA3_GALSU|nr:exosome complex component CSL4 [Galdieria sulphuraria]EME28258.1 exosome complex component CSL4 [Galdieria sulphuraria]|eukprot:XP_005704778.1 exosome complex component CSL4 [Galdieria sulphuraria]
MQHSTNRATAMFAVPGMELSEQGNFSIGTGCYCLHQRVYASLWGRVSFQETGEANSLRIDIQPRTRSQRSTCVPTVGDEVIGKVLKVTWRAVVVEIFAIQEKLLCYTFRGVVRLPDVATTSSDKIDLHNCFRPGDIIRAQVVSLGDPQAYYLSTSRSCDGVIYAMSSADPNQRI